MLKKPRLPKPFPHRCLECGAVAVFPEIADYPASLKYEGRLYEFRAHDITLNKCRNCDAMVVPSGSLDQITEAFRKHAELLTADEVRQELGRLGLKQKEFARLIGVAAETVSRWLNSTRIQTRALDKLMRIFFKRAEVRSDLAEMRIGV